MTTATRTVRSLWWLARPTGALWVPTLPLLGYGWGHWDRALLGRNGWALLAVLGAWALLHAGTMWLNAALDRDQGEVLYGRAVPVPEHTAIAGYVALVAAVALAAIGHLPSGLACAGCAILAVGYSHPRLALKGHPVGGPLINAIGYGFVSPLAGWLLVEVTPNARTLMTSAILVLWSLGWYFAAQAFQADEDAARGYRTLVVTHGPRLALGVARWFMRVAVLLTMALSAIGWFPRIVLVSLPLFWFADRWMGRWMREKGGGSEAWARGMARRLLIAGVVLMLLTYGEYLRASFAGEPVAGLGTVGGHPPDRAILPPAELRLMEATEEVPP